MLPRCYRNSGSRWQCDFLCPGQPGISGHPTYVTERSDQGERPKPVGHEDLNSNWVGAGDLKIGDKIKQADGTTGVVANVTTVQQTQEMFNLTVSEAHTFYVGQNGWLVHNCPAKAIVNWKSVPQFGHTFNTHGAGAKNTRSLIGRAASTGQEQGQWLDNQKAAEFLASLGKIDGPASVKLPDGLGQIIMPNGEIVPATIARIIPSPSGGFKTAFPVLPIK